MHSINFQPPFIAHRGANLLAPENTIAAFLIAKKLGATWIEFDVMLAACGEAVVFHDDTLERTTNGFGNVCDYPYRLLSTLDAGSWFDPRFAGERIPSFREVIAVIQKTSLRANVEIKAVPGSEQAVVEKVLRDIKQYWTAEMAPPLLSSFSVPVLQHIRQLSPNALIGLLIDEWFADWEQLCQQLRCVAVDVNHQIIDLQSIQKIQSMNLAILCYTVNDPLRARELFSFGVDAVFTDDLVSMLTLNE